ncbi:right-handed parallel beta-helix repeat-containing protein [Ruficoccus amylovorans]|uniref:Right-handed parallel beta-helix repeat-containing protein n=1 Tax=Ruficoccus amylovorans TaxID=1804625 RepID=A0A842HEW4_9BACT|nr:right-handed parallel beta-helix repeat-containing protein [Ruficoccus amylovorans]MBC2595145.1 right-handed parallel beta-helix repeat-containing protein [Ruficoccus amylovorans]
MRPALKLNLFALLSLLPVANAAEPVAVSLSDIQPASGAAVNESVEQIYLRVDPTFVLPEGEDPTDAPFKTIQSAVNAAIQYLERDIPVLISLRDFLYRESVTIPGNSLGALLVIQGDSRDGTLISGSEVLTEGWELADAEKNIWRHAWDRDWGDFMLDQSWSASQGKKAPQRLISQSRATSVALSWEPPTDQSAPIVAYRVYRQRIGTTEQDYRLVADELEETAWEDFSVEPATAFENNQYAYYVTAIDKWGNESRPSGIVNSRARDPEGPGYEPYVVRRRELLFLDSRPLKMVETPEALTAGKESGTFYVNDGYLRDRKDGYVLACLPAGKTPANSQIEAATNFNPGRKDASACLYIVDKPNLVLRNLSLAYSVQDGLRLDSCRNVLIEDVRAFRNGGNGIDINIQRQLQPVSEAVTLRRVQATENGACGINGSRFKNLLVEDSLTAMNNWRGDWGDFHGWDRAGLRLRNVHRGTVRHHTSGFNACAGIWLDYNNRGLLLDEMKSLSNIHSPGLIIQASQGPVAIRSSQFSANSVGLLLDNASDGLLEDSLLVDNFSAQLKIAVRDAQPVVDWTDQSEHSVRTGNWTWRNNIFAAAANDPERPAPALVEAPYTEWPFFYKTLHSSRNLWWTSHPARTVLLDGLQADFAGWQFASAQDLDSLLADPKLERDADTHLLTPAADSPIHDRANWPVTELPDDHREQFEATRPRPAPEGV